MEINKIKVRTVVIWLVFLIILFSVIKSNNLLSSDLINLFQISSNNLFAIFLTGLFVGGLSCLAVQGGLLAATLAQREELKLKEKTEKSNNALPIISFLIAKLVAYTILGFLLGLLGSFFNLSITSQIIMQTAVIIFMVGTALNLLNVHPVFRYFVIQPPKFLTRLVRKQSKQSTLFAPIVLGAFTVLIPCGTTQAMMALSIGSANPVMGAAILFSFVLGTSPLFFVLGYFATKLNDALHQKFIKIAALALILLAIFNANNTLALTGSNFTIENLFQNILITKTDKHLSIITNEATINIGEKGYTPNQFSIKAGAPVTLHLVNNESRSCSQAFTIPALGIQKTIPFGSSDTITFTAPNVKGPLTFMCSMGMYRGVMNVI